MNVQSLPSRGAWIEMGGNFTDAEGQQVAPLAGSVDRNGRCALEPSRLPGRSPRGERG